MGVLEVDKTVAVDGARCLSLQEQIRPLLSPPPDHAFIEPFFGHGRQGDPISYKLRAVIEMELASRNIDYAEVAPQRWKKEITGDGKAEKRTVKEAVEQLMGCSFPERLFIRRKWLKFRDDASDATAIGLGGMLQRGPLTFSAFLRVSAPGLPLPKLGKRYLAPSVLELSQTDAAIGAASTASSSTVTAAASASADVTSISAFSSTSKPVFTRVWRRALARKGVVLSH